MTAFFRSQVTAKFGMAVTGLLLVVFLIAHLSGNLLLFAGQDAFNDYAYYLKKNAPFLWAMRSGLLAVFVAHLWLAWRVKTSHRTARPVAYAYNNTVQASVASRTMILSGLVILAYVVFHLAHFTLGWITPETFHLTEKLPDGTERHDAYGMTVAGFSSIPLVLIYWAGMVVVGMHLSHALKSMLQTFGLRRSDWAPRIEFVVTLLGWLLVVAFSIIPAGVLLGIVEPAASSTP